MKNFSPVKISTLIFPLLFFIVTSLFYCFATPLWVPPDEDRHYVYSNYIARTSKLPFLDPKDDGHKVAQAIHPPLYYSLASLFCPTTQESIQENLIIDEKAGYTKVALSSSTEPDVFADITQSVYLLRLLSIFFSTIALYCLYRIILIIFPSEYYSALAATVFVAANPQFIHISASVSNEPMSIAFSALYLLALMVFLKKSFGYKQQIIAGLILGCCLLIKTSTIIYIPVTFFALAIAFPKDITAALKKSVLIVFIAAGVSGWWYIRNLLAYGDPVFSNALNIMQPWSLRTTPLSLEYAFFIFKISFVSFFGFFGAMQIPLSTLHLWLYGILITGAGAGYILRRSEKSLSSEQKRIMAWLTCALLFGLFLYCFFNITYKMYMGRYFYVVIVPIAVLFITGLRGLLPERRRAFLMLLISLVLVIVCWDVYFKIVSPSFAYSHLRAGIEQKNFCDFTQQITNTNSIKQSFVAPRDNLCAVRVMFERLVKPTNGDIRFALYETGDNRQPITQIFLPVSSIDSFSKFLFVFPPISASKGKHFEIVLDTQEDSAHQYPSLIYDKKTVLEEGTLYFNSLRQPGTLFFTTFHLSDDQPQNNWPERKAHYINEGWYVSIRELQLYGEFSRESMLRTHTAKKIQQIEKAFQNKDNQLN
jgi:hypothetical protein